MNTLGKILIAVTGVAATWVSAAAEQPAKSIAIAAQAGLPSRAAVADGPRPLKPVTWGMGQLSPEQATAHNVSLAPSQAAGAARPFVRPRPFAGADIVIDVMVAYTRKAARHYHDIESDVVDLAIQEANHSFRLSGLGHIRLRLAHTFQTGYRERGSHFDHLWYMADKADGDTEDIHALREVYRADVVVMIVDDPKGCGLATRVGADANEAFAVVHHACAATNYTLAHEIGHLMGARHELSYVSGTNWRDIMSYKDACGGCPRLPVWSNPLVSIGGMPAGTTELNNARIIAENAWRVAAFR